MCIWVHHGSLARFAGLADTVIVLPRIVPQVRSLDPDRTPTENFKVWDMAKLTGLVQHFCSLTGASTLPSLAEWSVLPDKVCPYSLTGNYIS